MEGRPTELIIRSGRPADAPVLQAVEVAAGARFHEVGMPDIANDDPPSVDALVGAIDDGRIWVATDDTDTPLGYAWAIDLDGQPHLEQLSVRPERNGEGIGSALIEQVMSWARAMGGDDVTLSTFREVEFNAPFYARRGFVVLDPHEHGERFERLRAHEAELGLDVDARVIMRRRI